MSLFSFFDVLFFVCCNVVLLIHRVMDHEDDTMNRSTAMSVRPSVCVSLMHAYPPFGWWNDE